MRALVIDDSSAIRQIIRRVLETRFGFVVSEAGEVMEALRCLDGGGPFDLVVTDINLPGNSGRSLVRRLKSQEATRSIPVLVVSVEVGSRRGMTDALEDGADAFLAKPFHLDELAEKVGRLLGPAVRG